MKEDKDVPFILGCLIMDTSRPLIDVQKIKLFLRLNKEHVVINVFKHIYYPTKSDNCFQIDVMDKVVADIFNHDQL